jgi:hypothetical protein
MKEGAALVTLASLEIMVQWEAQPCSFCGARLFIGESKGLCCTHGKYLLPRLPPWPRELEALASGEGATSVEFRQNCIAYQNTCNLTKLGVSDGVLAPRRGGNAKLSGGSTYHALRKPEEKQVSWLLTNPSNVTSDLDQEILQLLRGLLSKHPEIELLRRQGIYHHRDDDETDPDRDAELLRSVIAGPRVERARLDLMRASGDIAGAAAFEAQIARMDVADFHVLNELCVIDRTALYAAAIRDGLCQDRADIVRADNESVQRLSLHVSGASVPQATAINARVPGTAIIKRSVFAPIGTGGRPLSIQYDEAE